MSESLTREGLLTVMESMLKVQLRTLRHLRGETERKEEAGTETFRKKSNMSIVKDILEDAGEPLHINEIIARARKNHSVALNRESVVSAMTKRILDGRDFLRVGRNVFTLACEREG